MIVYALVNKKTNKVYIGQTKHPLSKRWNYGFNNCKVNSHLASSIQKYGADVFQREIIAYASCQQELDLLERFFIAVYQSTNPKFGYNQQSGGIMWRGFHTPEMRERIRKSCQKVWQRKTRAEKKRHAELSGMQWRDFSRKEQMRRRVSRTLQFVWDHKTEAQRKQVLQNLELGRQNGKTAWNDGKRLGPYSAERKNNISAGLKRHNEQKRLNPKKPDFEHLSKSQLQLVDPRQNASQAAVKVLAEMRRQLRHIEKTLNELNAEVKGNCLW